MTDNTENNTRPTSPLEHLVMPAPRIQLRWEPNAGSNYNWRCHYELVLPLKEHDVRRDACGEGKEVFELVVPMKEPSLRDSSATPCTFPNGNGRFADDPYRDGAHARWDAEVLGGLPVYIIAPDGMTFLQA